jgi:putative membrane protein
MSSSTSVAPKVPSDRTFFVFNGVLSTLALAFLFYILVVRQAGTTSHRDLSFLPAVNAGFNSLSALGLVAGYVAIRKGARQAHKYLMVSSFVSSSLFLVSYLTYHFVHGDTKYAGSGLIKTIYLLILASHVLLSMAVVPLVLSSFYFAFKGSFASHKRVTKFTLPIWLYVSVTGVVIYFMLRASYG